VSHAIKVHPDRVKSDPRDPKTSSPDYDECVAVGKKMWPKMEASMTPGQKSDYLRAVASNPNNVLGLAPTFPPLNKQAGVAGFRFGGIGEGTATDVLPCGHRWTIKGYSHDGIGYYRCSQGHEFTLQGESR
jgi:hypothetical protein